MGHAVIPKRPGAAAKRPNLDDYDRVRAGFSWEAARRELDGLPGGRGLNIAHEAVDRHAASGAGDRVALRCLGKTGATRELSYAALSAETSRFANALTTLGVGRGDRVFALTGRIPELYIACLGALKAGCVFCPLFSQFGPEPLSTRMAMGEARVLVTTRALYERKVAPLRAGLPRLEHVLVVGDEAPPGRERSDRSCARPRPAS